MSLSVPCFANGKDIILATMAFYVIDSACVVTADTSPASAALESSLENIQFQYSEQSENLSAMNNPLSNPVPYEANYTMTASIYLSSQGTSTAANAVRKWLMKQSNTATTAFNRIVLVSYTAGKGATTDKIAFWGRVTEYTEDFSKPKAMGTIKVEVIQVVDSVTGLQMLSQTFVAT